ncbi:hypothetical protein Zmor_020437 [Zophobas morio]|uniref:Mitochondrial cytochrome c oxidase subunit VIc/VIIs domain-containing protein n=1 Tax=Zophobas morio TaxID=2755281 RepID=A0AA38I483_9CUCU|nr:hypothetical protein Zmor_020437 [Zophobas morio]
MADEVTKIPKPKMRGLLMDQIKRNLILTFINMIISGLAFKFGYVERRKKIYADFYKNYDIECEFHRIRRKGLFDSCDPYEEAVYDDEKDEKEKSQGKTS